MPEITFPLSSAPGLGTQESGGRLVNAFTEALAKTARSGSVRRRVPGLILLTTATDRSHCRGFHFSNGVLYVALDNRLVKVTKSGSTYTVTDLGELEGTGPVTFAQNNCDIPDLVVVTSNGAFSFTDSSAPSSFNAPSLPQPNSCCQVSGYIVFTTLFGEIWATDLNSTTVNPESYTTAQSKSDTLLRGVSFRGDFLACGKYSIEVYANEGLDPFPLAFRTTIPRGLKGQWAIAGFEDGWSNELIWVGDDDKVYQLDGYRPVPISTHDVERAIASVTDADDLEASVYMHDGHAIWSLSSSDWTWEFNLTTGLWHERKSYLADRWRASRSIRAFDKWVAGDLETGKIFEISPSAKDEDGEPLIWEVTSGPGSAFPDRVAIPRVDFDVEVGVGETTGETTETDPQIGISWSDDGGASWSSPVMRSLGRRAKYRTTVTVNRTGLAGPKGRMWRLTCSDPVRIGLYGGTFAAEKRAA